MTTAPRLDPLTHSTPLYALRPIDSSPSNALRFSTPSDPRRRPPTPGPATLDPSIPSEPPRFPLPRPSTLVPARPPSTPSTPPTHRPIVPPTSSTAVLSIPHRPFEPLRPFDALRPPSISRPSSTLVPAQPPSNPPTYRPIVPPAFSTPVLRFLDALRSPLPLPLNPRPSTLDPRFRGSRAFLLYSANTSVG